MKRLSKCALGLAGAGAAALVYTFGIRPWHTAWGTKKDDLQRPMPLDEEVENPNHVTNRSITIEASPEQIWPWLVQMGELPRGGFYTYASIERLLGMAVENADTILPDYQTLRAGDHLDRDGNLTVKSVEPNRHLVLGPPPGVPSTHVTWSMVLLPVDAKTTRLLSRVRARITPNLRAGFWFVLLDPGQFMMERRWLLGVKERAEALARAQAALPEAPEVKVPDEIVIEEEAPDSEPALV